MTATNQKALSILAWQVYIADWASITALDDSLSNVATVISELDALSYERMASVTDVQFAVNTSDNQIKIETDDNWVIYQAYTPNARISWNWYEIGEMDVLEKVLGINSVDVSGTTDYTAYGSNLQVKELPKVVVKIVWNNDANGKNKTIYLYDAWLNGDLIQGFVDVVRAWDVPNSPFEFMGNRWGLRLVKDEINYQGA